MGRTKAEKLFNYVSQGEVFKVKSFLKKHHHDHRVDVNAKLAGRQQRQRTLLHLVCASGDDAMLRVLMKHGALADVQDSHGDTPLHLALERALHGHKHAFKDLVLPILKKSWPSSNILDIANKRGRTSRQLLQDVENASQEKVQQMTREFEDKGTESKRWGEEEAEWQARLQDEWTDDTAGMWDNPSWDDRGYTTHGHESFDVWATRIATEQRQKQQQRYDQAYPSGSHGRKQVEEREQREEDKRKFQRKLEEDHAKYQRRHSERLRKKLSRQKAEYLQRCGEVFRAADQEPNKLGFDDVPWPCCHGNVDKMIQVLVCDVDKDDAGELRKFVRSQQLLWHPDKFLQKCGGRLVENDRDKIMERVTQLSQALNQLGEDDKTK